MSFNYIEIERVTKLTKKEFLENYYKKQRPVVITNQIEDWPAFTKWNLDFIREIAGDKIVPLYDSRKTDYTKKVNEPDFKMTMAEYIDILERSEEHTSELQSRENLVCRLLLEKKNTMGSHRCF